MDAIVPGRPEIRCRGGTIFLNARLADAIDLALITKQAHWNIKGPHFIAIHEMLDGVPTELDDHVDTIAERAVAAWRHRARHDAGGRRRQTLKPYPTDIYKTKDHLAALIERYAAGRSSARAAIDEASEAATPTRPTSSPPIRAARQVAVVPGGAYQEKE